MALVPTDQDAEPAPGELVEAGVYESSSAAFERGLVVLAMGRPYWLVEDDRGFHLFVERVAIDEVRLQLASFERESIGWPPPPPEEAGAPRHFRMLSPLLWALITLAVFWGETGHPSWIDAGANDSRAIFILHEWWRPVTALFLHADAGHVLSNGLCGILVFTAVVSTFGRCRGWLTLAAASVLGNAAAAALHFSSDYRSIGASTAVFAGVGMLTGRAIRVILRAARPDRWRATFVPLASGITVLALYGAGGIHIDVLAHATGFAAGVVLGFASATQFQAGR